MSQYALRLPESLMRAAKSLALEDKASLNQFFVTAIAEKISALRTESLLQERAKRGDIKKALKVLEKVPD